MSTLSKKPDFSNILIGTLAFLLLWQLCSCASAEKLVGRAEKRGYVRQIVVKQVPVDVIIKGVNGKDSIITKFVDIPCPEETYPLTWKQQRKAWKFSLDSMEVIADMYKDSLKYALRNNRVDSRESTKETKQETKQQKQEHKTNVAIKKQDSKDKKTEAKASCNRWRTFIIGFLFGVLLVNIRKIVAFFKKLKI